MILAQKHSGQKGATLTCCMSWLFEEGSPENHGKKAEYLVTRKLQLLGAVWILRKLRTKSS